MIANMPAIFYQLYTPTTFVGTMSSKKGIIATVAILGLITAASFAIWALPQGGIGTQIVVTDYTRHLLDVDEQRTAMASAISDQFAGVLDQSVPTSDHIESAQESSVIIKRQIADLLRSGAPEQWHNSYRMYVESLRFLDEYVGETVVASKLIESGDGEPDLERLRVAFESSNASASASIEALP